MIRSVLVPIDFCEETTFLTAFAAGLVALGIRRVVVGHSVETSGLEGPVIVAAVDRARERMRDAAAALADAGAEGEVRVVTGDPAEAMIALASEAHVDAIVAGTHGKTAIGRILSGSVSEDLLAHADRPILFCRFDLLESSSDPSRVARDFGRMLVLPTDFSEPAARALDTVSDLPRQAIGEVRLLHVLDPSLAGEERREARHVAEEHLESAVASARERGLKASGVLRSGEPAVEILQVVEELSATGVVSGSRGRAALTEAVLGSVSLTLVRQAPCPVLVVP